jgi:acetyl esterase
MELRNPDIIDVSYGPHGRNVLDLWRIESPEPGPLFIFIHGGGFRGGDKQNAPPALVQGCLDAGIAVARINYRLSQQAPYPAPMTDSARAVQFLRFKAEEWNIDPRRFAAGGGSAGGGISLWLGFHSDLADLGNADPVARLSTRLSCMACTQTQSSYDLNFIHTIIPGPAYRHEAVQQLFRVTPEEFQTTRAKEQFADSSALTHLSAGDPPVHLAYFTPNLPLTDALDANQGIHHPRFGEILKKRMDELGIECVLRYREDFADIPDEQEVREKVFAEQVQFLERHLLGV